MTGVMLSGFSIFAFQLVKVDYEDEKFKYYSSTSSKVIIILVIIKIIINALKTY